MQEHVEHLLDQYYDHELNARQRLRVQAHLEQCASCRAQLARIERLSQVMADYSLPATLTSAETFRARVMLRVARRKRPPRGTWIWYAVSAGLGSVLVLFQTFAGLLAFLLTCLITIIRSLWVGWPGEYGIWLSRLLPLGWGLFNFSIYVSLCIVILLLLVPYAGWVGLLWRSTRSRQAG